MHARFIKTKHGWKCTHFWNLLNERFLYFPKVGDIDPVIYINVSKAPPVGKFCKRPHHYFQETDMFDPNAFEEEKIVDKWDLVLAAGILMVILSLIGISIVVWNFIA